jgi:hypothetical protein
MILLVYLSQKAEWSSEYYHSAPKLRLAESMRIQDEKRAQRNRPGYLRVFEPKTSARNYTKSTPKPRDNFTEAYT